MSRPSECDDINVNLKAALRKLENAIESTHPGLFRWRMEMPSFVEKEYYDGVWKIKKTWWYLMSPYLDRQYLTVKLATYVGRPNSNDDIRVNICNQKFDLWYDTKADIENILDLLQSFHNDHVIARHIIDLSKQIDDLRGNYAKLLHVIRGSHPHLRGADESVIIEHFRLMPSSSNFQEEVRPRLIRHQRRKSL
jgi:hypothetical protein